MDQPFEINIVHPGLRQFVGSDQNDEPLTPQSRMDDDLFDEPLNVEALYLVKFYTTLKQENIFIHLSDAPAVVKVVIDGLISDCSSILYDKYIESKLDNHVVERLDEYADFAQMQQYIDFEKSGYEEFLEPDYEPDSTNKDSWNRNQVVTEAETAGSLQKTQKNWGLESKLNASFYSTLSDGRSLRAFGITQNSLQNLFKGEKDKEKDKKNKDKNEPKAVPLKNIKKEIDIVEEQKRSFKERELKQKQEKQEQENQRQIEAKEQQYKLNRLNNDVKSKNITFDYDGNIIILQHVKVDRLPPTNYLMKFLHLSKFNSIVMVFKKLKQSHQRIYSKQKRNNKCKRMLNNLQISINSPIKRRNEEAQQILAPPMFETFAPSAGVTFTEGSKIKQGPKQGISSLSTKNMAILLSENSQSIRLSKNDYMNLIRGGNLSRSQTTQEEKTPQDSSIAKQKELASIDESLREGDSRRKNDKSITQDASVIKITNPKYLDELIQSAMEEPETKEQYRRQSCDQLAKFKDEDIAPNIFDQFNMSILKQKGEWGKGASGQKFLPSIAKAKKPDLNQISKEFQQNLYKLPRERFPRSLLMNSQSFKKLSGALAPLKENKSVVGNNFKKLPF